MKPKIIITPVATASDGAINLFPSASTMYLDVNADYPFADTNNAPKLPTGCTKARVTAYGGNVNVLATPAIAPGAGQPLTTVAYDSAAILVLDGDSITLDVPAGWYISAGLSVLW